MSTRWEPSTGLRPSNVCSLACARDDDFELSKAIEDLHPRDNTFPGEVFISVAVNALDAAGIDRDTRSPIRVYGSGTLRNAALGRDNKKTQFAVLVIGATRGGIEPDLLDEVVWWQADDFWWYALAASVAVTRSSRAIQRLTAAGHAAESGTDAVVVRRVRVTSSFAALDVHRARYPSSFGSNAWRPGSSLRLRRRHVRQARLRRPGNGRFGVDDHQLDPRPRSRTTDADELSVSPAAP